MGLPGRRKTRFADDDPLPGMGAPKPAEDPGDPGGAGFVHRYLHRLSRAFDAALTNAQTRGQLAAGVDPREEAEFFTASVLGLFVMLRATAPPTTIEHAARAAIRHLDTLRSR